MKRILVPVDFSPAMKGVLNMAREMARSFDAELHLLHVRELAAAQIFPAADVGYPGMGMPELSVSGGLAVAGLAPEGMPNEKRETQLDALAKNLVAEKLRVQVYEREGEVVEEILKAADEISAELIVMGSHGHGSVYNLLVGSVTEGVLKAGRRPLLLVPAPAAPAK